MTGNLSRKEERTTDLVVKAVLAGFRALALAFEEIRGINELTSRAASAGSCSDFV